MGVLVFELLDWGLEEYGVLDVVWCVDIVCLLGILVLQGVVVCVGVLLGYDFCMIFLFDFLIFWDDIIWCLYVVVEGDFVIVFYNFVFKMCWIFLVEV